MRRRAGRRKRDGGEGEFWEAEGGGGVLFLLTTKAVRRNNEHREWCVFREALDCVSV